MNDKTVKDAFMEVVVNQLETGDPPETRATLERLMAAGHSNSEAMQLIAAEPLRSHDRPRRIQAAPPQKRLGLRKAVGHQKPVLMGQIGFVPPCRNQKLAGNDAGALMDQLIEGVLAIRSRLAPDDGFTAIGSSGISTKPPLRHPRAEVLNRLPRSAPRGLRPGGAWPQAGGG